MERGRLQDRPLLGASRWNGTHIMLGSFWISNSAVLHRSVRFSVCQTTFVSNIHFPRFSDASRSSTDERFVQPVNVARCKVVIAAPLQAHVHHYTEYMELSRFTVARERVRSLIADYNALRKRSEVVPVNSRRRALV